MTPAYLNSPPSPFPFLELKEDQQLQFFIPPHQASSSLSSSIFFNITQDQRASHPGEWQKNQHEVNNKFSFHGGSSDHRVIPSSSVQLQPMVESCEELSVSKLEDEDQNKRDNEMNSACTRTDKQERIVHKFHDQQRDNSENNSSNNSSNIIRVCSDCNTTKTPLWRSGPQGPKSLCNACGIRQRKARRAMATAAVAANNGVVLAPDNSPRTKTQSKEKKSRTSYNMAQYKKAFNLPGSPQTGEKSSFEDFALSLIKNSSFRRTFPKDEEEAAVLLMALSCGLLHG